MSEALTFDESVADAADCLVEEHGLEDAIAELQQRRREEKETGRITEALAYLRYRRDRDD
jgi:hypothetical protein